jgi:hypothetical protein
LSRVSQSSFGKRSLVGFGGSVNNCFGVKRIFFSFIDIFEPVAIQTGKVHIQISAEIIVKCR